MAIAPLILPRVCWELRLSNDLFSVRPHPTNPALSFLKYLCVNLTVKNEYAYDSFVSPLFINNAAIDPMFHLVEDGDGTGWKFRTYFHYVWTAYIGYLCAFVEAHRPDLEVEVLPSYHPHDAHGDGTARYVFTHVPR